MIHVKKSSTLLLMLVACAISSAQTQSQPQSDWQRMFEMGLKYKTASDLYTALKTVAHGGQQSPPFAQLPDWSGLWMASGGGSFFGRGPTGVSPKLTPAAAAALQKGRELEAKGISYDENLSDCGPPGFPRWLVIPFLREFTVRPEQTWLSSETVNNVRRIYTDGRDHLPAEDRYPLYYGDSIGFWDGQKLVIHTNQLMKRSMGRNQPDQSDKMETVEIWEKGDARMVEAKVWVYDPELYVEPWYFTRQYTQVPNPDKSLRINYWNCSENPNNDVYKTPDGSTQYREFTFGPNDKR